MQMPGRVLGGGSVRIDTEYYGVTGAGLVRALGVGDGLQINAGYGLPRRSQQGIGG